MSKRDPADQALVEFILKTIKTRSTNDILNYNQRMQITLREMIQKGLTLQQLDDLPIDFIRDSLKNNEVSEEELLEAGWEKLDIFAPPPPPPPPPPRSGPSSQPYEEIGIHTITEPREELLHNLNTGNALIKDIQIGINRGTITRSDLYSIGCNDDFIDRLMMFDVDLATVFPKQHELPPLRKEATDVYFLGMRGSGKSTMLASFFSYTNNAGVLRNVPDNSFGNKYKNQLNLGMAAGHLPNSTPSEFINYVAVDLRYEGRKEFQALNFLDMAGEKIRAVVNGGIAEFQGYKDYLENNNDKVLIFVIDFFGNNRIKCLDQDQHLQEILALLKKFNVLRRTDAVYLILTKADLFPEANKQKFCDDYISKNYKNFLQACKEAKDEFKFKLKTFPFSIGPSRFGYILNDCDPDTNTNLITYPKILLQQLEEDCASGGKGWF